MSESTITSTGSVPMTEEESEGKLGKPGDKPEPSVGKGDPSQKDPNRPRETGSEGDGT